MGHSQDTVGREQPSATKSCHSYWLPAAEGSQGQWASGLSAAGHHRVLGKCNVGGAISWPCPTFPIRSLCHHQTPRCQFLENQLSPHQDPRFPITLFSLFTIKIPSRDPMSVIRLGHNNHLPMRLWKTISNPPADGCLYPKGHLVST